MPVIFSFVSLNHFCTNVPVITYLFEHVLNILQISTSYREDVKVQIKKGEEVSDHSSASCNELSIDIKEPSII